MIEIVGSKIQIYADIQSVDQIKDFSKYPWIKGFTTNPTLVRKGGSDSYIDFIKQASEASGALPISIEVIADDFNEMRNQANFLRKIGSNIIVKIPITNTKRESSISLIDDLLLNGIPVNITAVFTDAQIESITKIIKSESNCIVSVFAGRIADTGVDPIILMKKYKKIFRGFLNTKLLWASPREILNIFHAIESGADIITATPDILNKFPLLGKDLSEFSLETVKMFYTDAKLANFSFPSNHLF
jgi:transaldolase